MLQFLFWRLPAYLVLTVICLGGCSQALPATPTPIVIPLSTTLASPAPSLPTSSETPLPTPTAIPLPTPTSAIRSTPVFVTSFNGDTQPFVYPNAAAVDAMGNLYVIDADAALVKKLDSTGRFLAQWGGHNGAFQFGFRALDAGGKPVGETLKAACVAIDAKGNVYVGDSGNYRVQKFDADGNFLAEWGSQGEGDGQFAEGICVGLDRNGSVYVSDSVHHRVQKFDADGHFIRKWGSKGIKPGQFNTPWTVTADAEGNVHVVDIYNNRIQKFDPDGNFLAKFDIPPLDGRLVRPLGVALDSQGGFYILDSERVLKFDSEGMVLAVWGSPGPAEGQFTSVGTIAVDAQGNIYIADAGNGRIQKFRQP